MEEIIVALITACSTIFAVVWQSKKTNTRVHDMKLEARKDAIRNQILTLIVMDKQSVSEGKLPENSKEIYELFDEYTNLHGNHYLAKVVENYEKWIDGLETR